ncbi:type IIL restriction-modification enzyme MmeI [Dyadobacter sp. CY312]|uniref:type IIL restriction-modification enzyme MmeI n=1 Tax=Dyadobacter sp. CY312 TaxID=2907303 RepID=UPI001F225C3D|nr:type IIL restriction-modification enzyme MmeI [Dyadobacter sp. CY312]MCE7044609.1 hypothetical protein [Dyadobacter sp. CY312]
MNAVEIEEAISSLAEQPFEAAEFPYAFLEAFGNKETTISVLNLATATSQMLKVASCSKTTSISLFVRKAR